MKKLIAALLFIFVVNVPNLYSQEDYEEGENPPDAVLIGSLKTKWEINTENGKMRFEVRNARFGTRGSLNKYLSYRAEVDLSDEGKIKMLDAYIKFTPITNLDIYLGQRKVPFGSDYMRNPVQNMFANRSFVAKYVNNGLRDIGFAASYKFNCKIPIELWGSIMNGTGGNNPEWIVKPNYSMRLLVTPLKNFRVVANLYQGNTIFEQDLFMVGGELRYKSQRLLIEMEYLERSYNDTTATKIHQDAFYIHSLYHFPINTKIFKYINPLIRYDYMGSKLYETINAERITAGVNLGLFPTQFLGEIRLNYEKYLNGYLPIHFDKFTVEFVLSF